MAEILQFRKRDGEKPHHRSSDITTHHTRPKTNVEIFADAFEDVIGDWQRFATRNKLSEYVASKIPVSAVGPLGTDYVNDLNTISGIEQKLKMKVSVFSPGITHETQLGWMATFHLGKEVFSTPNDMVSEANARALLIVLYLHFMVIMKSLGRDVT